MRHLQDELYNGVNSAFDFTTVETHESRIQNEAQGGTGLYGR